MTEAFYTNKSNVRAAFEKAAPRYDAAAVLQREVSRRMAARLEYIRVNPAVVLDAGSGTGDSIVDLQQHYPQARLIELDFAYAMLCQSRAKKRRRFLKHILAQRHPWQICGDIEMLPLADASVDIIWSNLAIQWVNVPDQVFSEFCRVLKKGGMLMFSTLGPETLVELKQAFSGVDSATHVNRFIDMHDLGDALVQQGFSEPVMDMEKIVMVYDEARAVMKDLKAIGAHNTTEGRRRGLLGKAAWRRVEASYETFRCNGKLPATYEIVYGHAWKGDGMRRGGASTDGYQQIIEFDPSSRSR